jgi:hypothetical protein
MEAGAVVAGVYREHALRLIFGAFGSNADALGEFLDGLDKHLNQLTISPSAQTQGSLLTYIDQWMINAHLIGDPKWVAAVKESHDRILTGDVGEPIDGDELRRMVLG